MESHPPDEHPCDTLPCRNKGPERERGGVEPHRLQSVDQVMKLEGGGGRSYGNAEPASVNVPQWTSPATGRHKRKSECVCVVTVPATIGGMSDKSGGELGRSWPKASDVPDQARHTSPRESEAVDGYVAETAGPKMKEQVKKQVADDANADQWPDS